jgi:DNA-binding beta-propeller fold protein YncE
MQLVVFFALLLAGSLSAQSPDLSLWVTLGDSDQLVEVDPLSYRELRRITVDPHPHGLAILSDGSKVYLASDRTGNFQVVDARTGRITGQLHLGNDPNQMTLTKDGRFAYVPLRADNKIAVVPLEPSEDGKTIYVALSSLLGFVVVDPATRTVTRRVELGTLPEGMPEPYKQTWTHALQIANGGRELWLADDINDLIRIVRLADMREVAQIRTGHFPHWFAMRPDGRVLFVSLWFSDAVAAIDVRTRKVLHNFQFERGGGPKRIAIARRVR